MRELPGEEEEAGAGGTVLKESPACAEAAACDPDNCFRIDQKIPPLALDP
jgi:hypothetical protein